MSGEPSFSEDDEITFKEPNMVMSGVPGDQDGTENDEEAPPSPAVDIHTSAAMFRQDNQARSNVMETDEDRERREEEERVKREIWAGVGEIRKEREEKEKAEKRKRALAAKRRKRAAAAAAAKKQGSKDTELSEKALAARRKREEERAKFKAFRLQQQKGRKTQTKTTETDHANQETAPTEPVIVIAGADALENDNQNSKDHEDSKDLEDNKEEKDDRHPPLQDNPSATHVADQDPGNATEQTPSISEDDVVDLEDMLDDGNLTMDLTMVNDNLNLSMAKPVANAGAANVSSSKETENSMEIQATKKKESSSSASEDGKQKGNQDLQRELEKAQEKLRSEQEERANLQKALAQYEKTMTQMLDEGNAHVLEKVKKLAHFEAESTKLAAQVEQLTLSNKTFKKASDVAQAELKKEKEQQAKLKELIRQTAENHKKDIQKAQQAESEAKKEASRHRAASLKALSLKKETEKELEELKKSYQSLEKELQAEKNKPAAHHAEDKGQDEGGTSVSWRLRCQKAETQLASVKACLEAKTNENAELVVICDELLAHASHHEKK